MDLLLIWGLIYPKKIILPKKYVGIVRYKGHARIINFEFILGPKSNLFLKLIEINLDLC